METNSISKGVKIGITILIVIGLLYIGFYSLRSTSDSLQDQVVSYNEPIDVLLDFYQPWLDAMQSTTTNPYEIGLEKNPILSVQLREKLKTSSDNQDIDPVLCQSIVPTKISSRTILEQPDTVQFMVLSREPVQIGQAAVTLLRLNDGWYIDDISCTQGEVDMFSDGMFESKGVLITNLPSPYDPNIWHLGFTEDALRVKIVPLFFDSESMCVDENNTETICDSNTFIETTMVLLQGDMTEAGVEVTRVEFTQ